MNRFRAPGLLCVIAVAGCNTQSNSPEPADLAAFRTSAAAYLTPTRPGVTVTAIATVGDLLPGSGEALAPTPDGIGVWAGRSGVMNLMLNHEVRGVPRIDGEIDYRYARVSKMEIELQTLSVLSHTYVVDGSEGYEVFCAANWVDEAEGFPHGYFFTGEELDFSGRQIAIDEAGSIIEMPWIGHFSHESQIVVPGFATATVLLNFDDSTTHPERNGRSISELYMYVGRDPDAVMAGDGQLYVFAPRPGESGNVGDLVAGDSAIGQWKPIPDSVARQPDGAVLQAYVDSIGVYEFVRPEDGWYDKRPDHGPGAMFYDTGRDERVLNGARTGPADPWGSLYYVDFDTSDPAAESVLTLMARSSGPDNGWASPDNGDMLADGTIMLNEDPSNTPWNRPPGVFQLRMTGPKSVSAGTMIAEITDPDCAGEPTCADSVRGWETSGITDASEFLGPGSWVLTVQAHLKAVPALGLAGENGQLLLMHVPGD
ncbi:MAG: hypothetical protein E4H28_01480 [Gemmatimonadales bacterium]|nr:MAG: hypothetical protein E4H28_01480 [Gemmatimonadales bacterium]